MAGAGGSGGAGLREGGQGRFGTRHQRACLVAPVLVLQHLLPARRARGARQRRRPRPRAACTSCAPRTLYAAQTPARWPGAGRGARGAHQMRLRALTNQLETCCTVTAASAASSAFSCAAPRPARSRRTADGCLMSLGALPRRRRRLGGGRERARDATWSFGYGRLRLRRIQSLSSVTA